MDGVAVLIGHDLKLDVMRVDDQFLDVNLGVPESFFRFRSRAVKALHKAGFVMRGAHPASAAAGDGFDHHRITNFFRDFDRLGFGFDNAIAARA